MVHKEIKKSGELMVWMSGVLLYKRWSNGKSVVFEKYGPPTSSSERDMGTSSS